MNAFRTDAWPAFVGRVRRNLLATYPHFLPCFPEAIQSRIVDNMLDRARHWGFLQQASLFAFCEMMVEVAPNFDDNAEIAQVIQNLGDGRDHHFPELAQQLPPRLARLARQNSSTLPLFVPAHLREAPLDQALAAAIGLALGDRPAAVEPARAAKEAIEQADALGFAAFQDAPLVVAACRSFWGADFVRLPWAMNLGREDWTAGELLALLRLRVALDFGRYL